MVPLDSVLDIDGNRHVFDRLRGLIEASARLFLLWPTLVHLLAFQCDRRLAEALTGSCPVTGLPA